MLNIFRRLFDKTICFRFGPHEIPRKYGTEHCQCVGATGSGKTEIAKRLMKSILEADLHARIYIYDPKTELVPIVYKLNGDDEESVKSGKSRVKILNPFDQRSYAWDMAADIKSPVAARQIATNFFPSESANGHDNPYFVNAAIDILVTIFLIFMMCMPNPGSWTFRDVLLVAMNAHYMRFLFNYAEMSGRFELPTVSRVKMAYIDTDPRTAANIASTICTHLAVFEPVAACMDAARKEGRVISLERWVEDDCQDILILGTEETARATMNAVNRALFKRVSELVVGRRESTYEERESGANQTWFFLDEIREAGHLDGLRTLLNMGRSRSACVALFYQDFQGLIDVYGESVAEELTGQCNNAAFLRIVNPSTAKWACEAFGTSLDIGRGSGISFGDDTSYNHESHEEERPLLYTSDFLYMPMAGKKNGICGYYRLADFHPKTSKDAFAKFVPEHFKSPPSKRATPKVESAWLSAFYPRPISDQFLQPWNTDDWARLGLPGSPPSWRCDESEDKGQLVSNLLQAYLDDPERSM